MSETADFGEGDETKDVVAEKTDKMSIFRDLEKFKGKRVKILLYGGGEVDGELSGFDEASNCVLEGKNRSKCVVLGRSIVGICECCENDCSTTNDEEDTIQTP